MFESVTSCLQGRNEVSLVMLQSNVYLKLILHVDRIHYFLDLLIIWNVQVRLSKVKTMFTLCYRFCRSA